MILHGKISVTSMHMCIGDPLKMTRISSILFTATPYRRPLAHALQMGYGKSPACPNPSPPMAPPILPSSFLVTGHYLPRRAAFRLENVDPGQPPTDPTSSRSIWSSRLGIKAGDAPHMLRLTWAWSRLCTLRQNILCLPWIMRRSMCMTPAEITRRRCKAT